MKKTGFIVLTLAIAGICLWGCGQKEPSSEELMQDPMSMESLSTMTATDTKAMPGMKPEVGIQEVKPAAVTAEPKLEPLPPAGPYKPTSSEIQTALKNAGYYDGNIDGKVGPKTKKAIQDFQKANSLEADGKVGPKTWAVLGPYLDTAAMEAAASKPAGKKKR
ncbi:MAG: peptidoglycan-binding domain-containing protein [Candidatus Omnitrophota bacterium]